MVPERAGVSNYRCLMFNRINIFKVRYGLSIWAFSQTRLSRHYSLHWGCAALCTVLHVLQCPALFCIALPCPAMSCIVLHCPALSYIALHCLACLALSCIVLHCPALSCIVQHVLHCPALSWIALHCPALSCTSFGQHCVSSLLHFLSCQKGKDKTPLFIFILLYEKKLKKLLKHADFFVAKRKNST
jgi:hypothetical protein